MSTVLASPPPRPTALTALCAALLWLGLSSGCAGAGGAKRTEALRRRVTLASEAGEYSALLALAEEKGRMVVVQCTFPGGTGALPEVCRGLFSVR